ncbi:hypothetical protein OPQ81_010511 [Rhizoctonia solani]|nr:hypothetical protein OPQ81_010511 [Rhizoctonia solani]
MFATNGMICVNGWCFCEKHGLEYCDPCTCDFRDLNIERVYEATKDLEDEEGEIVMEAIGDWHRGNSLSVYQYGNLMNKKSGDEDILRCIKHSKEECPECFDFVKQIFKAAGVAEPPKKTTSSDSIDPGLSEPLVKSRFNPKNTGQAFPKLPASLPKHDLDLDYPGFLTYEQLPPNDIPVHEWVFLGTIVNNQSIWRPMANPLGTELAQLSPGQMISFQGVFQHGFMDGQVGLRIEDEDLINLKILPCSVRKFQAINKQLCSEGNKCKSCGKDNAPLQCANCRSRYCNRECQMKDWKATPDPHSKLCAIIEHLRSLNIIFH